MLVDLSSWICSYDLWWFKSTNRMRQVQGPSFDTSCQVDVLHLWSQTGLCPRVIGHQHIKWGLFLCFHPVGDVYVYTCIRMYCFKTQFLFDSVCKGLIPYLACLLQSIEWVHKLANFISVPLCYEAFQLFHVYFLFDTPCRYASLTSIASISQSRSAACANRYQIDSYLAAGLKVFS